MSDDNAKNDNYDAAKEIMKINNVNITKDYNLKMNKEDVKQKSDKTKPETQNPKEETDRKVPEPKEPENTPSSNSPSDDGPK